MSFPASPVDGDYYTSPSGVRYQYKAAGPAWVVAPFIGGGAAAVTEEVTYASIGTTADSGRLVGVNRVTHAPLVVGDDGKWQPLGDDGVVKPEWFGATGGNSAHNDSPGIQAALDRSKTTGEVVWLHPGRHYYCMDTLTFNSVKTTMYGNSAKLDFSLKTYVDPNDNAELVTNYNFDSGSTGWTTSAFNVNTAISYSGSHLTVTGTDGVSGGLYSELGQHITGLVAGKMYRFKIVLGSITPLTHGGDTQQYVSVSIRPTAIGSGATGETLRTMKVDDFEYPGRTWTFDVYVPYTAGYLTIGSNNGYVMESISIKEAPLNMGILVRSEAGSPQYGHNSHGIDRVELIGPAADSHTLADAIYFDTDVSTLSSRMNLTNCEFGLGWGRGLVFANRAYLIHMFGTAIRARVAAIDTVIGSADSFENLSFFGGVLYNSGIAVRNMAKAHMHFFGLSWDYCDQFYVGGGQIELHGCHLETFQFTSTDSARSDWADRQYRVDLIQGEFKMIGGYIITAQDPETNTVANHFFRIAAFARVLLQHTSVYDIMGASGEVATGAGRIDVDGLGGDIQKWVPPIMSSSGSGSSNNHNAFGSGGLNEGTSVGVLCWCKDPTGVSFTRVDRSHIEYRTSATVSTTATRGSNVVTMGSTTGRAAGEIVVNAGFPSGTVVVSVDSGTQLTLSQNYNGATGATSVLYYAATTPGGFGFDLSTAEHHSGTQSLKFYKTGFGTSTTAIGYVAMPIRKRRGFGMHLWYKIPAFGSGSQYIFFQGYFVRILASDNLGTTPIVQEELFMSDQPVNFDQAVGKPWTELTLSTHKISTSSPHDSYAPEWATHAVLYINAVSMGAGFNLHLDDMKGQSW